MPLFAICSSQMCVYRLKLPQEEDGISRPTPSNCPQCKSPLIFACPQCDFPLLGDLIGENPRCEVCRADIRQIFVLRRARQQFA